MYLIINYIYIESSEITVGVTDNERWAWDTEDGYSGVDAKTHVMVLLDMQKGKSFRKEVHFFLLPGDPVYKLATQYVYELFQIAWEIHKQQLSWEQARERYFGKKLE